MLGIAVNVSDLHELQPDVVKGLISLLQWNEDDDGGAVEEVFGLDFQVMHKSNNGGGDLQYHDLLPQGSTIDVTAKNRVKYVELYLDWYMNEVVAAAFSSFALGFWTVVDGHTLRLFSPSELELLIEGENTLDMVRRSGVGRWARRVDFLWPLLTLVLFLLFCSGGVGKTRHGVRRRVQWDARGNSSVLGHCA